MDVVLIIGTTCFLIPGILLGVLVARLLKSSGDDGLADGISEAVFAPNGYRPMERLLDGADYTYLRSHPAWNGRMNKNFRKARIRLFRGYLRELTRDFKQVRRLIRVLMVTSEVDRSHLAVLLFKQQLCFAASMISVEVSLILYGLGWSRVDVSGVIFVLNTLKVQLQGVVAAPAPAAA